MCRHIFLTAFLVCQLLLSYACFAYVVPDDCKIPVARLGRSVRFDLPALREEYIRDIISRVESFYQCYSSSEGTNFPVSIADGVGTIFVQGNDIHTDGVTELEGSVPISGNVAFGGPLRASGTVTIAGKCKPASGSSPLRIGQPLLPRSLPLPPAKSPVVEVPRLPEVIPGPVYEILPKSNPVPIPTVTIPPVIIPAMFLPTYVIPEVIIPVSDLYDLSSGFGNLYVTGNDIVVSGATYLDGLVPTVGEVTFGGFVPAKGTVTVCSCF